MDDWGYEESLDMPIPDPVGEVIEGIEELENKTGKLEKLVSEYFTRLLSKEQLVRSTAVVVGTLPLGVWGDLYPAHLTIHESLITKLIQTAGFYIASGAAASMARDRVTKDSKGWGRVVKDVFDWTAFNTALAPIGYYLGNLVSYIIKEPLTSFEGILRASLIQGGVSFLNGLPMGYAEDVALDMTGVKECKRSFYAKLTKKMSPKAKKRVIMLAMTGMLGLTAGIYGLKDYQLSHDNTNTVQVREVPQNYQLQRKSLENYLGRNN